MAIAPGHTLNDPGPTHWLLIVTNKALSTDFEKSKKAHEEDALRFSNAGGLRRVTAPGLLLRASRADRLRCA